MLADGGECDLDLGNYERYLGITLGRDHNISESLGETWGYDGIVADEGPFSPATGKIYNHIIEKERRGDYLGKTGRQWHLLSSDACTNLLQYKSSLI